MTVRQRVAGVRASSPALKFVLMVGIMSFFADFTYEGSRSVVGPYLGLLGAGAFTISVVSGAGEFIGYNIRLFSGRGADRTGKYWPITIGGYVLQMSVVPLLALAGSWQVAALLIIAERIGKGIRNPPRDAMLSHAAKDIGYGWGVQESLIPAAVAPMVSPDRRAFAYGLFTGIYGTAWVLGSIVIGVLVTVSLGGLIAFCVASELAAIPLILIVRKRTRSTGA